MQIVHLTFQKSIYILIAACIFLGINIAPADGIYTLNTKRDTENCDEHGSVRLVGGTDYSNGRVEICMENRGQKGPVWGTVCNDEFDERDARVVCNQIHLQNRVATVAPEGKYEAGSGPIHLDEVNCFGSEAKLTDCSFTGGWDVNCFHSEDVAVDCKYVPEGKVRLTNGATEMEGRVEVFYMGEWGTVCDSQWDDRDGQVVCRELGLEYVSSSTNSAFGEKFGWPIFMDEVDCEGTEERLADCGHSGYKNVKCSHFNEAGVTCRAQK